MAQSGVAFPYALSSAETAEALRVRESETHSDDDLLTRLATVLRKVVASGPGSMAWFFDRRERQQVQWPPIEGRRADE